MDNQFTATFSRAGVKAREDRGAHRRVHLDTYAQKTRASKLAKELDSPVVEQQAVQASIQQAQLVLQPAVVAIPIQSETPSYVQPQPDYSGLQYIPETPQVQSPSISQVQSIVTPPQPKRSYLDTLKKRHETAVTQAPAAEETVFQEPTLETQELFEATKQESKIEANLNALYAGSLTDMIAKNTQSASAAHIRTIVASAFACGVLAVGIFSFLSKYDSQPVIAQPIGAPVIEVESSNSARPTGTPLNNNNGVFVADPSHPVRMIISSLGVNAPVEGLGTTADGLIAVPKSYGVVGWYNKGSVPGKAGPAVLVGHYTGGHKGVFDGLKDIKDGDLITTVNGRGQSFTYRVTAKAEYEKDKVPMAEIFKKSDESRLEIITCAGKWQANNYDKRLVVTAELVK